MSFREKRGMLVPTQVAQDFRPAYIADVKVRAASLSRQRDYFCNGREWTKMD